jgi:hypothetical protein
MLMAHVFVSGHMLRAQRVLAILHNIVKCQHPMIIWLLSPTSTTNDLTLWKKFHPSTD